MRRLSLVVLAAFFIAAGAAPALANKSAGNSAATSAMLIKLEQGDITDSVYPVVLVRIDGEPVTGGHRKYLEVPAGPHVIRLKPDKATIEKFQRGRADNYPIPGYLPEQDLKVTLEPGMNYKIAVRRDGDSWANFEPFVLKSWPMGSEEPQPDNG